MGGLEDGSMSSPPKIEYLPATENGDGSMSVDISSLSSPENPDIVSASVNFVARYYRSKNKELRVKVPLEYFSVIHPLRQMGFNKIEDSESTYIVLREQDESLQIASGVTQIPSETACEQGLELQHSSWAFPSGPASMGNDNEAAGLQGFSVGPKIPVQTKKRPHSIDKSKRPRTRPRGPDYGDEAKGLLLQFRLEYLQDPANEGKSHKWLMPVTEKMKEKGYDRDPGSLRGLWETTKKSRDAMRRAFPEGSTNYWDLTMDEKKSLKQVDRDFPLTFEHKWVAAMEKIEKMEPRSATKKRFEETDKREYLLNHWLQQLQARPTSQAQVLQMRTFKLQCDTPAKPVLKEVMKTCSL